MDRDKRENRAYTSSKLPVLDAAVNMGPSTKNKGEILDSLYGEICNTWRMLTDVRFKLLGFIPSVSGIALFTLFTQNSDPSKRVPVYLLSILALFAFTIVLGLWVYDTRNSELYDDLISRGRKIEEDLGVDTGLFRGRLNSHGLIKHDVATGIIYGAVELIWIFAAIAVWFI